jgi:uncharacterized membrane protein
MGRRMAKPTDAARIHFAFEISLALKGAFALAEIGAGAFTFFVTGHFLYGLVDAVTRTELSEDPHDFIANYLLQGAQTLSVGSRHFTALYLLSHGVIKLWLIAGLWRKRLGYYPTAIAIFCLFIAYQVYRYRLTHSLLLLLLSALDVAVIVLTWLEYRDLRRGT